jgi:hypothetical protein
LGVDRQVVFTSPETVISDITAPGLDEATYFWEQIGGPQCLRFNDYNKDRFRVIRYTTSTNYNPDIYIRQSGTYKLRCTRNTNGIIESDEIIISTEQLPSGSEISLPSASSYNKIIDSVPRKLGFNKYGMISILDTNHYIRDDKTFKNVADFGELNTFRLKDVKIDVRKQGFIPQSADAELKLYFLAANGNTKILVNSVTLENARDSNSYGQCASFCEEKIYRDPNSPNLPILGSSNFSRDYGYQYSLVYYNNLGQVLSIPNSTPSFPPNVGTVCAPEIIPYGGYSKTKVDTIAKSNPAPPPKKEDISLFVRVLVNGTFVFIFSNFIRSIMCNFKRSLPIGSIF